MNKKEVLLLLTDHWADWEASYASAEINSTEEYAIKTISIDKVSKVSIGGLRTEIDYDILGYKDFDNLAMVILPGGFSWEENDYKEVVEFLEKAQSFNVPIAAICGATVFLARKGFLDDVEHTGDEPDYFEDLDGYNGQKKYIFAQVAVDKGIITANETAAVEFAYEIFKLLKIDSNEEIDMWYDKFKSGMVK